MIAESPVKLTAEEERELLRREAAKYAALDRLRTCLKAAREAVRLKNTAQKEYDRAVKAYLVLAEKKWPEIQ